MEAPEAVVFDLGKVLLDFDYSIAIRRIQQRCRLAEPELQALINQSPLLHRYETNLLTSEQFFAEVKAATEFCGEFDEFQGMFADIFSPIEPMIELHAELRQNNVPTYIFSNTNDIAIGHIRARFPFFKNFDGYVLSYEHSVMKPDPRIYEAVETVTGCRGPQLLYIDDRAENIAAAQQRAWRTILHVAAEPTRAAVVATGLLPTDR
jgi:HAD superfamily hydrolase (TIGR01509 family)